MLDVYKEFYNLTEVPFRLSPDHRFSFEHPSYAEAKAYLEYAIFQGEGFITVTGLPGTGKTTLIGEILSEVDPSHIRVATITSTQLDARDFLHMVAAAFGLQFGEENKVTLLRALAHFLIQQHQRGLRCVLIVDEAQGLSPSALEELRLLANLQHKNSLVLQVCLVGQERLRNIIGAPEMEHLRQRLIASAHLDPLDLDETITYIEHRLGCAGWHGDPAFSEAALRRIYQASGGIPRRINLICNRMFLYGGLEKKHELGEEHAQRMINELREEMLLAPGEAVASAAADTAGQEAGDVVRRLPRGEMPATGETHDQPPPMPQPVERPAAVKADFFAGVAAFTPPATAAREQPDEVTAQPPPAPPAQPPAIEPPPPPAPPPPARARAVAGEPSVPSPEETPDKPKGGRLKILLQIIIALLLAAVLAFMLIKASQENWYKLLKQGPVSQDVAPREAKPEMNQPRAAVVPETQDAQKPPGRKPEVAQSSSKVQPNRDARRQDNAASAIPAPVAEIPDETKEPGLRIPSTAAAPITAAQPAVTKQVATVNNPQADIAKKIALLQKQKTAVVKQIDAVKKNKGAIEAKRLPSKGQAGQRVEQLNKPPGQSLPGAAKPEDTTALKNNVAAATASAQPSARLTRPAFPADDVRSALLAGRWSREGQPTNILPSEATFCNVVQQAINCWSVPRRFNNRDGAVAIKVEATLKDFTDKGEFQILYNTLVKSINAGQTDDEPWRVSGRELICEMLKPDTVSCQDQNGNTSKYHRSGLSR